MPRYMIYVDGFYVDGVNDWQNTEKDAIACAKDEARLHPGIEVLIFTATHRIETEQKVVKL